MTGRKEPNYLQFSCNDTVILYRILVLDAGRVVEFGAPRELLESKGNFYGMAKDAGIV